MGWLKGFIKRTSPDDEVARELRAHLEMEVEDLVDQGRTREEAQTAARRLVGNVTLAKEQVHDLSPWAWWAQLWQDVRYGLRTLRHAPVFATTAILTLGLGVGANSALFSVIDALVLRPLPVSRPQALVVVRERENGNFSYPDYLTLRDENSSLDALIAASSLRRATVNVGGESESATARIVSADYFAGLGIQPKRGRVFTPADATTPSAVISDGYWTRRFGRSPDVIDRQIRLLGSSLTIVGIAPPGFFGETPGEAPDFWASIAVQRRVLLNERGFSWLYLMGRLKPGVSIEQAQTDLAARFAAVSPAPAKDNKTRVAVESGVTGLSRWRDRVGSPLWILMAVVGLVLLIACTNLATLLLTRGAVRQSEIAMRLAIGASRGRLVRQLLTESLLLSTAGGLLSLVFAAWGGRMLVRMASAIGTGPDLNLDLALNLRLMLFTAAVSTVAGLLFGIAPALREIGNASRRIPVARPRVVGLDRPWGLRGALIAIQVALSLMLVACSVMFIRTVRNLEGQDLGFRADGLVRVEIETESGYEPTAAVVASLLARTAEIPGIQGVTSVVGGTLANTGGVTGLQFEGFTPREDQDRRARADWVGPNYLRVAGIRVAAGRDFTVGDDERAPRVVIINQAAARHYFGTDLTSLGRRMTWKKDYEIIGVAENAKYADLRERTPRLVYLPTLQSESGLNALEVRTAMDGRALTSVMRGVVRTVDSRFVVGETLSAAERVDRRLGRERLVADLSGFFGVLTLLLISIGIYGTVAYSVGHRTKELGVRLALGGRRTGVMWLVLHDVAKVVMTGVAIGLAGAWEAGRLVQSLLFGLQPADPVTFAIATSLLIGVALVAGLTPAIRASRLDPAQVLRE